MFAVAVEVNNNKKNEKKSEHTQKESGSNGLMYVGSLPAPDICGFYYYLLHTSSKHNNNKKKKTVNKKRSNIENNKKKSINILVNSIFVLILCFPLFFCTH